MTGTLLRAVGLTRRFDLPHRLGTPRRQMVAVDRVDLAVDPGDVLAIVGESGSGKTTLARLLLGLLPPQEGEVRFQGELAAGMDKRRLAGIVQPVFQDPSSSLNPRRRVLEAITQPLQAQGRGKAGERREAALAAMDLVGLPRRYARAYPVQLSGGQRQRVAIARALVARPLLLICDEPTSALDVSVQAQILNLLQDLRGSLGVSYILITHNLAVVRYLATDIAVMYRGRIVEQQSAERLFAAPRHPYTRALLGSVLTPVPGLGLPDLPTETGLGGGEGGCPYRGRCVDAVAACAATDPVPVVLAGGGFAACLRVTG